MQPAKTNGHATQSAKGGGAPAKREKIERIVHSDTFREREPLKRLLTYLADRTLAGAAGSLKEYTVGVEVFHKPDATIRSGTARSASTSGNCAKSWRSTTGPKV